MPAALGEAVSAPNPIWQSALERTNRLLAITAAGQRRMGAYLGIWGSCSGLGVVILARRGAWLMVFIILGSIGLVCTTPWPAQFARYLAPLAPFLDNRCRSGPCPRSLLVYECGNFVGRSLLGDWRSLASWCPASSCRPILRRGYSVGHQSEDAIWFAPGASKAELVASFFTTAPGGHGRKPSAGSTRTYRRRDRRHDITAPLLPPHGRRAVFPPMEIDPAHARRLLEAVPVSYVIVDAFSYPIDSSRRYALPAVESSGLLARRA